MFDLVTETKMFSASQERAKYYERIADEARAAAELRNQPKPPIVRHISGEDFMATQVFRNVDPNTIALHPTSVSTEQNLSPELHTIFAASLVMNAIGSAIQDRQKTPEQ
jgi:hypothetical protein